MGKHTKIPNDTTIEVNGVTYPVTVLALDMKSVVVLVVQSLGLRWVVDPVFTDENVSAALDVLRGMIEHEVSPTNRPFTKKAAPARSQAFELADDAVREAEAALDKCITDRNRAIKMAQIKVDVARAAREGTK
jgi:hypothetical protein